MKTARFHKIILLFTALVLSFIVAFGLMNFSVAGAESVSKKETTDYFYLTNNSSAEFDGTALKATLADEGKITFKNKLIANDFAIELSVPAKSTLSVIFSGSSYYVHGNAYVVDGKVEAYHKDIDNVVTLTAGENATDKVSVSLNGRASTELTPDANGIVKLSVNVVLGRFAIGEMVEDNDYYRVKDVDGKAPVAIALKLDCPEGVDKGEVKVLSVDQKASDVTGKFKQTFVVTSDKFEVAYPRVAVSETFYAKNESGAYKAYKFADGTKYTVTTTAYSVLGGVYGSDIFLSVDDANKDKVHFGKENEPDALYFKSLGNISVNVSGKDGDTVVNYETISVEVIDEATDTAVPYYVNDAVALGGFKEALKAEYTITKTDENGNEKVTSAPLGTAFEIPSMQDLVFDNVTPYDSLKSKTYYSTVSTSSTSSDLEFDIDDVGEYIFFVAFEDLSGNAMKEEDFRTVDGDEVTMGDYKDYIFDFEIFDDSDISVSAAIKQGVGYKGVKYTASKFTIDASGCTLTYKLYYNADVKATVDTESGWKLIPKASTVTDKTYVTEDGYTYDQVKAFAYDGNLTFVPTERGSYKIVCTATSDVSPRTATASTVINVENEPTTVKVDTKWVQNNIWSIVFLSVGTLCLIGIIVLLCIKPKEDADND